MMILLIFTLYQISGPVGCLDVIGYLGGIVMIYCEHQQYGLSDKYFCQETPKECFHVQTQKIWVHKDRVSLFDSGYLTVIYRNLSLEDAGSYQCGETGVWNYTVDLSVKTDPCCLGSKTVIGYLGKTVIIHCYYPDEFEADIKYFYKQRSPYFPAVISTLQTLRGRFSISDDRRSKVVRVGISDVEGDDGGVYFCGIGIGGKLFSYYTLFTQIQLIPVKEATETLRLSTAIKPTTGLKEKAPVMPTARPITVQPTIQSRAVTKRRMSTSPMPMTTSKEPSTPGSSFIIIVTVCVVLVLLIGGLALIFYRLRCTKTQESPITSRRPGTNTMHEDQEEYGQAMPSLPSATPLINLVP
ncbi:uncharacterized protein [Salminus brasiliensis]|uniref:uncharacterized protein n=1 Tax=Salminus brasiliensis TaxID=930266 RepID=UPI003B838CF6